MEVAMDAGHGRALALPRPARRRLGEQGGALAGETVDQAAGWPGRGVAGPLERCRSAASIWSPTALLPALDLASALRPRGREGRIVRSARRARRAARRGGGRRPRRRSRACRRAPRSGPVVLAQRAPPRRARCSLSSTQPQASPWLRTSPWTMASVCGVPSARDPHHLAQERGAHWHSPPSVRCRVISASGWMPGRTRRISLTIATSPTISEELDCSAESQRISAASTVTSRLVEMARCPGSGSRHRGVVDRRFPVARPWRIARAKRLEREGVGEEADPAARVRTRARASCCGKGGVGPSSQAMPQGHEVALGRARRPSASISASRISPGTRHGTA